MKTSPEDGEFELRLVPEDTNDLRFGTKVANFYYDIEAKFSSTNIVAITSGTFSVVRKITRIE